jgi:hypothetical protein
MDFNMGFGRVYLAGLVCALGLIFVACSHQDWRTADRGSAGLAPSPETEKEAVVQVYAARAVRWRGYFGVHSWIALKEKNADFYTTYHVMGFRIQRTGTSIVSERDIPDRRWFGAEPTLVSTLVGPAAERAIPKIHAAVDGYPYKDTYRIYPGPNSNTFISYILRRVPEIGVELPPNAIGKDWINKGDIFGLTESGTGVQVSLLGLLGFSLGLAEGVEVNLLGMTLGVDFWRPAIKLPFAGRFGFTDARVFEE